MNTFRGRIFSFGLAVAAMALSGCSGTETPSVDHDTDHSSHWGYESGNGPVEWGSMTPDWILCAEGLAQSPIDLTSATETELPSLQIQLPSRQEVAVLNQRGVIGALDNGHTIQVNANTGETLTVADKKYGLVQFHFHAPSEHTVDGEHFPMEMHFVHQAEDGTLAVLGVFVEEGDHNPAIEPFFSHLGNPPGTETAVRMPARFPERLLSGDATAVYHYEGSLTTPPCSEGVQWYLRKAPTQLSKDQIAAFTAIYDHNNRPVQPLNGRTLHADESPTVTIR